MRRPYRSANVTLLSSPDSRPPTPTPDPCPLILDCHVHTAALLPGHGRISERARTSIAFRILRRQLGLAADADDAATERALERTLLDTLAGAPELDAAVVLAFDRVYTRDGRADDAATHFHIANEYVASLAAQHTKILLAHRFTRFGRTPPRRSNAVSKRVRCYASGCRSLSASIPPTRSARRRTRHSRTSGYPCSVILDGSMCSQSSTALSLPQHVSSRRSNEE